MDTALGFLGLAVWIVTVVALAAGVTWLVVKVSPGEKPGERKAPSSSA